jgi:hypothetical protein
MGCCSYVQNSYTTEGCVCCVPFVAVYCQFYVSLQRHFSYAIPTRDFSYSSRKLDLVTEFSCWTAGVTTSTSLHSYVYVVCTTHEINLYTEVVFVLPPAFSFFEITQRISTKFCVWRSALKVIVGMSC